MEESNTITCLVGEREGSSQTARICGCYCCSLCSPVMPSATFHLYGGHLWNMPSTRPEQASTCVLLTDTWRKRAMGHLKSVAFNPNSGLYDFFETLPSIANNAQVLTVKYAALSLHWQCSCLLFFWREEVANLLAFSVPAFTYLIDAQQILQSVGVKPKRRGKSPFLSHFVVWLCSDWLRYSRIS